MNPQITKYDTDPRYDGVDPLDTRYYDQEISRFLSDRRRIAYLCEVESVLGHTLAEFDVIRPEIATAISNAVKNVTAEAVYAEEIITKHDINALISVIRQQLNEEAKPYVHFGATTYDVVATANSRQFKVATTDLLIPRMKSLVNMLLDLTEKYADTKQVGRVHGQHTIPTTFGYVMSGYVVRLGSSVKSLKVLAEKLPGKFSGSVGGYNALSMFTNDPMKFEISLLEKLELSPAPYSTEIIPGEYMARLIDEVTVACGIMANLANDMRHLMRSEIAEVRQQAEPDPVTGELQVHGRNPRSFENVAGLYKQVLAQSVNANLNISSEHQRDLTDSASSRFYAVPIAAAATMSQRLYRAMTKIEADEANMQRNLHLTGGAIASEALSLLLARYGHPNAQSAAAKMAQDAQGKNMPLTQALLASRELNSYYQRFNDRERQVLSEPETYYTGLAADRARKLAEYWRVSLES